MPASGISEVKSKKKGRVYNKKAERLNRVIWAIPGGRESVFMNLNPDTTVLHLNGVRQYPGFQNDYIILGNQFIVFNDTKLSSDMVLVDYDEI